MNVYQTSQFKWDWKITSLPDLGYCPSGLKGIRTKWVSFKRRSTSAHKDTTTVIIYLPFCAHTWPKRQKSHPHYVIIHGAETCQRWLLPALVIKWMQIKVIITNINVKTDLLQLGTPDIPFGAGKFFVGGASLCIVGCLAASLTTPH